MAKADQPKTIADLLIVEVMPGWTKEKVALKGGVAYARGTVLSVKGGVHQVLAPAASDGTEKAVGVLADPVAAPAAGAPGLSIARGAVVDIVELAWPAGITAPQTVAALADLEARGIVARAVQVN